MQIFFDSVERGLVDSVILCMIKSTQNRTDCKKLANDGCDPRTAVSQIIPKNVQSRSDTFGFVCKPPERKHCHSVVSVAEIRISRLPQRRRA